LEGNPSAANLRITLLAKKPRDSAYPKEIKKLGDQVKTRRLDLGLTQREAAVRLGVSELAVRNWEIGCSEVGCRLRPRIFQFLGILDPMVPTGDSLSERLTRLRLQTGLSLAEVARIAGSSVLTLKKLENGEIKGYRWPGILKRLEAFLEAASHDEPPHGTETATRERRSAKTDSKTSTQCSRRFKQA